MLSYLLQAMPSGFLLHKRNKPLCIKPLNVGSVTCAQTHLELHSLPWYNLVGLNRITVHLNGVTSGCAVNSLRNCIWWPRPKLHFAKAVTLLMFQPQFNLTGNADTLLKISPNHSPRIKLVTSLSTSSGFLIHLIWLKNIQFYY